MSHRNWFLTIIENNIIPIAWLAILVSILLTAATYFIEPVYSVKSELCLDASIAKLLPELEGTPSTTANDYIRMEYFAFNSVSLMQKPEIGRKIISDHNLTDKTGKKLSAENLINPSSLDLLFSNNGQGVTVQWISDTQQFSITGYGKDANTAALLSAHYTDSFVNYDKEQFKDTLENIKKRQLIIISKTITKRSAVEKEQIALRKEYGVADWTGRLQSLTSSLGDVEQEIASENIAESTTSQRIEELEKQVEELKNPLHVTIGERKSETLTTLQQSLTSLNLSLIEVAVDFTPQHPEHKKLQDQIDSLKEQIKTETKREYALSTHSTSDALDSIITSLMLAREEQAVRAETISELTALKNQYIDNLNFTGRGNALYTNLEETRTNLSDLVNSTEIHIIEIESLLRQPFSFFRVITSPYVDQDNLKSYIYLPQRKATLILSFIAVFLLGLFFIVIRELHLETLFFAWQLNSLPEKVEAVDIVYHRSTGELSPACRQIFHSPGEAGQIIRIRRLDSASNPDSVARLGAGFFANSGEPTLLIYNWKAQPGHDHSEGQGLHSWLSGHLTNISAEIKNSGKGYDILSDSHRNSDEPWIMTLAKIRDLFITFSESYNNIILVEPSLHSDRRLAGDAIVPDIDILTVNGGSLSADQTIEMVRHENQTYQAGKTIILVINNKESLNLFSTKGFIQLIIRFFKAPFEIFSRQKSSHR